MKSFSYLQRQSGFAIITGVFLVVILALLGVAIIAINVFQSKSASLDTLGARAYQAAKAGIEAGAYNSLRNNLCAAQTINFTGTLTGFTANVSCVRTPHTEGATTINTDTITSVACNQAPCPNATPANNYVERQLTTVVENP